MEVDRYKGGIVFKWLNKEEIYNKYNGKGKPQNLQAYIDKLHVGYIATRSGVDNGIDTHGLFGNILDTEEVELLELDTIKKYIKEISNKNIDVFKTVICLKEADALEYGYMSKKAWKDLLEERILEISKGFKIPLNDMEWVASFHAKKEKPHCHLVVWNKNQDLSVKRKPYIFFNKIKAAIAKGVFKEELEVMYNIKDVSKEQIGKLSKEEFEKYKENIKEIYNNKDLMLRAVSTEETQNFVNKALEDMKTDEIIYIVNNSDPDNFTEITKRDNNKFEFKNIGEKALLYKDNTYLEAVTFLSKFSDLRVMYSKEELQKFLDKKQEEFENIESELKEIMPSVFNTPIISSNIKQERIDEIINKIAKLEKVTNSYKRGFIYQYQEPEAKRIINEISLLLVNSNNDCKNKFTIYIDSCVKIDKILQKINTYKDYEKSKNTARYEMLKKVGNQLLKFIKETKTEEYARRKQEWLERKEYWNQRNKEYEEARGEYEARQEIYEKQLQEINIRNLIQDTYKLLSEENISKFQKYKRATRTFGDLSKREIKELMRRNKDAGIDWYHEM